MKYLELLYLIYQSFIHIKTVTSNLQYHDNSNTVIHMLILWLLWVLAVIHTLPLENIILNISLLLNIRKWVHLVGIYIVILQ